MGAKGNEENVCIDGLNLRGPLLPYSNFPQIFVIFAIETITPKRRINNINTRLQFYMIFNTNCLQIRPSTFEQDVRKKHDTG